MSELVSIPMINLLRLIVITTLLFGAVSAAESSVTQVQTSKEIKISNIRQLTDGRDARFLIEPRAFIRISESRKDRLIVTIVPGSHSLSVAKIQFLMHGKPISEELPVKADVGVGEALTVTVKKPTGFEMGFFPEEKAELTLNATLK